jgi:serine/threonine protein kinase
MPPSPLLDARYELRARIGRGGMAEVYEAWDHRLAREVAVKLLHADCSRDAGVLERFRQESHTLAQLNHPNIVTLFDSGETAERRFYLVMERLRGQPFDALLRGYRARGEVFGWRRLVAVLRPVCAALQAAHTRQIVHRDIKPSNLFLHRPGGGDEGDEDFVKILDFGIVKMLTGAERRPGANIHTLTSDGLFVGTPHYASPESVEPQLFGPVGVAADVYALGVIMYQCLAGVLPFEGEARARTVYLTAYEDPPLLRDRVPELLIAPAIDAVVMRALARRPEDRYPSVRALLAAIHQVPDEPTAPRAIVASRSLSGTLDATTQIRRAARKMKRATLAWGAAKSALESIPAARPLRRTAPEFLPVAMHIEAPESEHETVKDPTPSPTVDPPAPVVVRPPTRPEMPPYDQNPPTTSSEYLLQRPTEVADTPLPTGALVNRDRKASGVSVGLVLAMLALLAVIGYAWWLMPDAPTPASKVEHRTE